MIVEIGRLFMEFLYQIFLFFIEIAPFMMIGLVFVGLLHVLVSKDFVARHIGNNNIWSAVKASILGVPLPLCSCGVIPTAVYFSRSGASKGSIISFLISTPQTGIDSIVATYGMLGPVFAVFRPLAAFFSGISGGFIANIFSKNDSFEFIDTSKKENVSCNGNNCHNSKNENKISRFYHYAFVEFLDDIAVQFVVGVIIAGIISFLVPPEFFIRYNIGSGFIGMMLMIIAGIPMYICATASIPIALALIAKGVSPGAAFVFLAVGPMTNAASIAVLYKVLKKKMLTIYILTGTVFAVIFGLILDYIFIKFKIELPVVNYNHSHNTPFKRYFYYILSAIFAVFLIMSLYRKITSKFYRKDKKISLDHSEFKIEGMTCNHCVANVKTAVEPINGVQAVDVDLALKRLLLTGKNIDNNEVIKAVENAGYKINKKD